MDYQDINNSNQTGQRKPLAHPTLYIEEQDASAFIGLDIRTLTAPHPADAGLINVDDSNMDDSNFDDYLFIEHVQLRHWDNIDEHQEALVDTLEQIRYRLSKATRFEMPRLLAQLRYAIRMLHYNRIERILHC